MSPLLLLTLLLDRRGDNGQTAAEYALVLLGAATIALLVVAWATRTDAIGRLLDSVFGEILDRARD